MTANLECNYIAKSISKTKFPAKDLISQSPTWVEMEAAFYWVEMEAAFYMNHYIRSYTNIHVKEMLSTRAGKFYINPPMDSTIGAQVPRKEGKNMLKSSLKKLLCHHTTQPFSYS